MDILHDPSESIGGFDLPEVGADRQPGGNAPNGLMEKTGVARPEAPHEVVHRQFEGLRIGYRNNPFALAFCSLRPAGTVERRVEVVPKNRSFGLIEDFCALVPAQLLRPAE